VGLGGRRTSRGRRAEASRASSGRASGGREPVVERQGSGVAASREAASREAATSREVVSREVTPRLGGLRAQNQISPRLGFCIGRVTPLIPSTFLVSLELCPTEITFFEVFFQLSLICFFPVLP
jgi:hypothetical protein